MPDRTPLPVLLSGLHHLPPCQVNQKETLHEVFSKTETLEEVCNEHHEGWCVNNVRQFSFILLYLSLAYIREYEREVYFMSYLYFTFERGGRFMRIHY